MNVELLKKICETPGAPGREAKVRALVYRELESLADSISTDNMGNVYALKKGTTSDKKMMVAAHMDEIGFVVTHIDDKGFLRFHPLGGFDPKTLTNQRVVVHGTESLVGVMGGKTDSRNGSRRKKQSTENIRLLHRSWFACRRSKESDCGG